VRLLLDSHIVLWLTTDVPRRSSGALDAIVDEANDTRVSAVSLWELESKRLKGQLDAPADLLGRLEDAGFRLLSLTPDNALDAARLPRHHGDPFDRLLVAQAQGETATLVTADEALAVYDVPVMRIGGSG